MDGVRHSWVKGGPGFSECPFEAGGSWEERVFPPTGDEVWYHKLNSSNRETSFLRAPCMIDNKMKVTSINLVTS